jgi:hypothetical protein
VSAYYKAVAGELGPKYLRLRIVPTDWNIVEYRNAPKTRWKTLFKVCDAEQARELMQERAIRWGATIEKAQP